MGLYDTIHGSDPRLVCSEGHALDGLQTYELGRTAGDAWIEDGKLTVAPGGYGDPVELPFTGPMELIATCRQCPARVSRRGRLHAVTCELVVTFVEDRVVDIVRTTPSTAAQLDAPPPLDDPDDDWDDPMPHADALALCFTRAKG